MRHDSFTEQEGGCGFPVTWHGAKPGRPDWSWESRNLAVQISEKTSNTSSGMTDIYIAANAHWEALTMELPKLTGSIKRLRVVDTILESLEDIAEEDKEPCLDDQNVYEISPRSVVVLIGK